MNSFKLLCAALMDTVIGMLTFNLPMTRVPHSNKSAGLTIAVSVVAFAVEASLGNVFPSILMGMLASVVAIEYHHWKEHVPRLPDGPSRLVAATYVLAMTYLINTAIVIAGEVAFPDGWDGWITGLASFWTILVLVSVAPRIKRHQIALLAAANAPASEVLAPDETASDPSNSNQP